MTALALGILLVGLYVGGTRTAPIGGEDDPPHVIADPSIDVEIVELPPLGGSQQIRARARKAIETSVRDLYETAFLTASRRFLEPDLEPMPTPTSPDGSPLPAQPPPIGHFFTDGARAAILETPGLFWLGDSALIERGVVRFSGVFTVVDRGLQALIRLEAELEGRLVDEERRPVRRIRVAQVGQLFYVNPGGGWLVDAFDLELKAERELLDVAPTAAAYAGSG